MTDDKRLAEIRERQRLRRWAAQAVPMNIAETDDIDYLLSLLAAPPPSDAVEAESLNARCRRVWVCMRCGNCMDHCKHPYDESRFHEDLTMPCSVRLAASPLQELLTRERWRHETDVRETNLSYEEWRRNRQARISKGEPEKDLAGAASRSLLPTQERDSWQPIRTAPRDGTEVLLFVERRAGIRDRCVVGHYMPGGYCIEDHPAIDEGWYYYSGSMFDKATNPKHWMPLPSPPRQGSPLPANEGEK